MWYRTPFSPTFALKLRILFCCTILLLSVREIYIHIDSFSFFIYIFFWRILSFSVSCFFFFYICFFEFTISQQHQKTMAMKYNQKGNKNVQFLPFFGISLFFFLSLMLFFCFELYKSVAKRMIHNHRRETTT